MSNLKIGMNRSIIKDEKKMCHSVREWNKIWINGPNTISTIDLIKNYFIK